MGEQYDTEITLGVGKLLMLFFGLVILCGVFLGVGYTMGHNSAKADQAAAAVGDGLILAQPAANGANKPNASQNAAAPAKPTDCPEGQNCTPADQQAQQQPSSDLTFYKAVEQKDASAQLQPQKPVAPQTNEPVKAPEMKASPGAGYMVQVAAVSKREDAEVLTDALRRKQYPVVVLTMPTDKLFHVQLGPFADLKDAESMKTRLVSDGYNPIVKK